MGRQDAGTNVMLDAYLRWVKGRVGAYVGRPTPITSSGSSPVTNALTVGTDTPFQQLTITGSGVYTFELDTVGATPGDAFWIRVTTSAGAGDAIFKSGVGGTTILTLPAPPTGTFTYHVNLGFDTAWTVLNVNTPDPLALAQSANIPGVGGMLTTSSVTFLRIGTLRVDPTQYPANAQVTFWGFLEATAGKVAELQLFNLSDSSIVAGSLLTGNQPVATYYEAVVTLPSASKDYEVQLRMTTTGGLTDQVACTNAGVRLEWR